MPMNYGNIEEIVKAHSKAVDDANDMVVNILSQDKRQNPDKVAAKLSDAPEEDSQSLMNYLLETNRILYSHIVKGFSKFITGFTTGQGKNFLIFIESEEVQQGMNQTTAENQVRLVIKSPTGFDIDSVILADTPNFN